MKQIILLLLFLPTLLFAQYPNSGNKSRLGYQTTGDGLIWRGVAADTAIKPRTTANAYFQLDTVNRILRRYIATQGSWQVVGGGGASIDSLVYSTIKGLNDSIQAEKQTLSFANPLLGISDGNNVDLSPLLSGYVTGSGTNNRVSKWSALTNLTDSNIQDDGTAVSILSSRPFQLGQWTTAGRPTGTAGYMGWRDGTTLEWYNGTRWAAGLESTSRTFTTGSLIFADANGQAAQNNAKLFWNNGLGYLGINRNTGLGFNLDVNGNARIGALVIENNGSAGATGQGISVISGLGLKFIAQGLRNVANANVFEFAPYGGAMFLMQNSANRDIAIVDITGTYTAPNFIGTKFDPIRIRPSYNFTVTPSAPPFVEINGISYEPALTNMYITAHNFMKINSGNILFGISGSGVFGYGTINPSRSSVIDFVSTSKGALLPRMTTSQRNAVPTSVLSATLTNAGSGYSSLPTCTITGGGGSGAIAFANISAGAITSISILNPGEGYTSTPTLTITGGGGTGGAATLNLAPLPESLLLYNIDSTTFEFLDNTLAYRQIATKQYARLLFSATTWLKPQLEAGDVTISKATTPSSLNFKNVNVAIKDANAKTTHLMTNSGGIGAYVAYKTGDAGHLGGTYALADTLGKDFVFYTLQDDATVQQNIGSGPQIVNYITHPSLPATGAAWFYGMRIDTSVSIPTIRHMYGNRYVATTNPGTHKFMAGLRSDETVSGFDFFSVGSNGKMAFNVNSALNIRQGGKVFFAADSTFIFDPATDLLQLSEYGTSATTAATLSKTESGYVSSFATDGTVLSKPDNTERYNTVTSTTSPVTLSNTVSDNLINQGSTQATFTLNFPASPVDGQVLKITYNNAITTLTLDGNGNTIVGSAVTTGVAGSQRAFKFYTGIGWIKLY